MRGYKYYLYLFLLISVSATASPSIKINKSTYIIHGTTADQLRGVSIGK